ncbi:alcohol oxidase-like protein [Xylariaceae sp. FL0662B]|nr:alcohol oxidase-like protein [Xylariaceae sp. FL0662B]
MGLFTNLPGSIGEVDVIVAGGGTAACIVASRLADADKSLTILVIEAGDNNYNVPTIVNPIFLFTHVLPTSNTALFYKGGNETQLANREVVVPSGGVLGGGSSINFLTYSRAQRSDFDSWETPGWSAEELLPYLQKLENYHGQGTQSRHGYDGPIHVSRGTYHVSRCEDDFIASAKTLGWPEIEDLQDLDANNGVQRSMRYISPDGKRQDTAHAYLHPRLHDGKHPNLHVLVQSQVTRVLFENRKAIGVEFKPSLDSPRDGADPVDNSLRSIRARKMVIMACGALGTPSVLERSGIGSPEVLQSAGVDLIANLPGVGENYSDHHLLLYSYRTGLTSDETVDGLVSGRVDAGEMMKRQDKMLGWNAMDITCKFRPSESDVNTLGPEFQEAWNRDFSNSPNKPLALMSLISCFPGDQTKLPPGQYMAVSTFSVYPYSRGSIHVTGPKLSDPLDFKTGFFSDAHDVDIKKCTWAYKAQREIVRRMDVYRGEVASAHPPFPAGSKAVCVELDGPLGRDVPNLEYTAEDDAIIEQWLRENVGSTWHSLGTCKMAPQDQMGVVDATLSVYGVQGLKVADLSIAPLNVAANTNNTAMAVGEKAADIFIKELGLDK